MIGKQEKKELQQQFFQKSTTDHSQNIGDWNRQSNGWEKINMEKEVNKKVVSKRKKNDWSDGRKNKMSNNMSRKWQVGKIEIHKIKQ